MSESHHVVHDVGAAGAVPADGTLSRTIHHDDRIKVVAFTFSAGQELSEHTASRPAVMHFLSGQAKVTLGEEEVEARPGTWIHMRAGIKHAIRAESAVGMLLTLL